MAVRQPIESETARPPLKIVAPREGELAPPRKKGIELPRRGFLILAGAAVAGVGLAVAEEQLGILSAGAKAATNLVENLLENRSGDPLRILESQYLLLTPSEGEIRKLAFIPKGEPIWDNYTKTVSPQLQERAKKAGYHLTWQGNPNDTVGRTVLCGTERSIQNHYYDVGFGWWFSPEARTIEEAPAVSIRGVFKGWVKPPDSLILTAFEKSKNVQPYYAKMENPLTGQTFLVRVNFQRQGERFMPPFRFCVDNLDVGGDPANAGTVNITRLPNNQGWTWSEFDTVIQQGDLMEFFMMVWPAKVNNQHRDNFDVLKLSGSDDCLYIRRFGGEHQVKTELDLLFSSQKK